MQRPRAVVGTAADLTVRRAAWVVAGMEVEVVVGGDEVVWAGDVALLQGGVEPVVSVHATLCQGIRKRVRGDVEGGLREREKGRKMLLNANSGSTCHAQKFGCNNDCTSSAPGGLLPGDGAEAQTLRRCPQNPWMSQGGGPLPNPTPLPTGTSCTVGALLP